MEPHCDGVRGLELAEGEEVVIAIVRCVRSQPTDWRAHGPGSRRRRSASTSGLVRALRAIRFAEEPEFTSRLERTPRNAASSCSKAAPSLPRRISFRPG